MMKRFFRSFSCLALVCLLLLSSFAFAAGTPTIAVESKTVPLGTESVTLSVSIADNPGLAGMMISLKYDPALRLTKVEKGTALSKLAFTPGGDLSANPFKVLWDALEADGSNGEFLRLTFALPKVAGRYSVTPTMRKGETFDNNMNDVVPVLTPAVITVGDGGAAVPPAPVAPVVPVTPAAPVNPFTDIAKGTYYYDAVLWAYSH
ncbi:MAG: hypothetical protein IJ980_03510, partial [Oscillospiraceae bacterium]|nr:hypothetical protein [Oscillospiraceae bacterium]